MMLSSFAARLVREILLAFAFSFINPVVIAINFIYVLTKLATETGINSVAIPGRLVPVYIGTGMGISIAITLILFLATRLILKLSFSKFSSVNAWAHLPFFPFFYFSILLIWGAPEGNLLGFIVVPLFLLVSFIAIPASVFIASWRIGEYLHKQ